MKPIFIIGAGRSGSTIFHRVFTEHGQLSHLSNLCERYPTRPALNRRLMRVIDLPHVGRWARRGAPPSECYAFWEHHCHGFRRPCRDLTRDDLLPGVAERMRSALAEATAPHRPRLLVKLTGWPRIGLLQAIFPDAKFIHIKRDGRAMACSALNVPFWRGWQGPAGWRWGELSPGQRAEWERHDRSFVALAGIQWKILMAAYDAAGRAADSEALMEIRYEDLCAEPLPTFERVVRFCGLEWQAAFERSVAGYTLRSANEKWRTGLTAAQQTILDDVLRESLPQYGYPE